MFVKVAWFILLPFFLPGYCPLYININLRLEIGALMYELGRTARIEKRSPTSYQYYQLMQA